MGKSKRRLRDYAGTQELVTTFSKDMFFEEKKKFCCKKTRKTQSVLKKLNNTCSYLRKFIIVLNTCFHQPGVLGKHAKQDI